MKAVYLEATLSFLRFTAKQYSIAQLFGGSYQLYAAIRPHIPNSAEGNCLTEKENHTPCLKSGIKEKIVNYQNIIVRNSPALDRHVFVPSQKVIIRSHRP